MLADSERDIFYIIIRSNYYAVYLRNKHLHTVQCIYKNDFKVKIPRFASLGSCINNFLIYINVLIIGPHPGE
jgi:hypothetical protein